MWAAEVDLSKKTRQRVKGSSLETCWWQRDRTRLWVQSSGLILDFWRSTSHPRMRRKCWGEGDSTESSPEPRQRERAARWKLSVLSEGTAAAAAAGKPAGEGKGGKERGKRPVKDGLHWREKGREWKRTGEGVCECSWAGCTVGNKAPGLKKKSRIWFKFARRQSGQLSAFTPKSRWVWSPKYPMDRANKTWVYLFLTPFEPVCLSTCWKQPHVGRSSGPGATNPSSLLEGEQGRMFPILTGFTCSERDLG